MPISAEKKPRNFVAIDETVVKANNMSIRKDVERDELILMSVYTTRKLFNCEVFYQGSA